MDLTSRRSCARRYAVGRLALVTGVLAFASIAAACAQPSSDAPPSSVAQPVITGTVRVNSTLSTTVGEWAGDPTTFTHQWQSCDAAAPTSCTDVGTDGPDYVVAPSDLGRLVQVRVTGTDATGAATQLSVAVGPILPKLVEGSRGRGLGGVRHGPIVRGHQRPTGLRLGVERRARLLARRGLRRDRWVQVDGTHGRLGLRPRRWFRLPVPGCRGVSLRRHSRLGHVHPRSGQHDRCQDDRDADAATADRTHHRRAGIPGRRRAGRAGQLPLSRVPRSLGRRRPPPSGRGPAGCRRQGARSTNWIAGRDLRALTRLGTVGPAEWHVIVRSGDSVVEWRVEDSTPAH